MKSIKPGRGPSFLGGIVSIVVGLFGIVWTVVASGMGGGIFALFGVLFITVAVVTAVYNFKNATGKNRYSAFDITDGDEEPDPLNERFGRETSDSVRSIGDQENVFCPYCGNKVEDGFEYCNKCGKRLP